MANVLAIKSGASWIYFYKDEMHSSANLIAYDALDSVSSIIVTASTPQVLGLTQREAPTLRVSLFNKNHRFFKLFRLPFRREAKILDLNGKEVFSGKIRAIKYGLVVELEIGV